MKTHSFRKFLLDHEDFVSGMSLVSFCNDFEQPLQHTENLIFFAAKYSPPFYEIFVQEMPIQRPFLLVYRLSKFLLHILRQTRCCQETTQRAHDVIMTSDRRRCDGMASHLRRSDVIMTSCACWVFHLHLNSCKIYSKKHY